MVEAIRSVYAVRIQNLDWMSDTTKAKALDKLQRMTKKVGYPDKWKDYSALVIGTNSYCENMINASRWKFHDRVSKYGKPIDRTEWDMTPQTYNAYYNPSNNEIVLPAAIFIIPGTPDSLADDAVVYGYAGASTIGHEITHGFDDQGRNFDAAGNLTNWWTSSDAEKFKARAQVMIDQFSAFEPLPGKHINGEATIGENIADYGGILLGWDAFVQTEQYKKGELIGGYTPAQRYFMGYALGWMSHQREEALAQRLLTDVHSPAKWRVNGPFANVPAFYEAFNVKEGSAMWRADSLRVSIW
jgi:putative endopeptidase